MEGKEITEEEEITETPDLIPREYTPDSESSILPHLKIPAPLGLKILDDHLKQKKLRLIDLFTSTDKNKDWRISRDEFIKSCEEVYMGDSYYKLDVIESDFHIY
jgi:hypothetical protein